MVSAVRLLDLSDDEVELTTHAEPAATSGLDPRFGRGPLLPGRQGYDPMVPGPTWATIVDARLLIEPGFDGVVYLSDGRVVWESNRFVRPGAGAAIFGGGLPTLDRLEVADRLPSATIAFDPGWINYYHWLLQVLPLMLHASTALAASDLVLPDHDAYRDRAITPAFGPSVRTDSLAACLDATAHVGNEVPVRVLRPGLYRVDRLRLPLPVNHREHNMIFDGALGRRFRDEVRGVLAPTSRDRGSRLFVRRGPGSNRDLEAWETEALDRLAAAADFVPVELERMSFREQVAAFAGAEAILGAHGSGLANLVFADRTVLHEYLNPHRDEPVVRGHFQVLAAQLGHKADVIDRWALRDRFDALVSALEPSCEPSPVS